MSMIIARRKKNVGGVLAYCGVCCALLVPFRVSAVADADDGYFLPEIIVRAQSQLNDTRTTDKWLVDKDDLIAINALTVADALRYQPGLNIQYGASSAEARAWIRGFRDRDVLVLYDGIPIASAFEGTIDLNEVSSGPVDRIQVSKTAPSVVYGANGLGGVVDVIPLRPDATSTILHAEVGQAKTAILRATSGFSLPMASVAVSVGHASTDSTPMPDTYSTASYQTGSRRTNSDFRRNDALVRATTNLWDMGETAFTYMGVWASKGLPPNLGPDKPKFERLNRSDRQSFIFSQQLGDAAAIKGYYNTYDFELSEYEGGDYAVIEQTDRGSDNAFGLRAYNTINFDTGGTLLLAASYGREKYTADNTFLDTTSESVDTYSLASELSGVNESATLNWRLGVIATHFEGSNGTRVRALNPQIVAEYAMSPATMLRASYAQRTRFPKLNELYERRYGNPSLSEVESNNAELTLTTNVSNAISLSGSIFYNQIDGLIEKPARTLPYANLEDAVIKGAELAGTFILASNASVSAGGALIEAEEQLEEGGKRQIRSRPRVSGYVDARTNWGNLDLGVRAEYVSQLYDVTRDGVYTELDDFLVVSAKASWQFTDSLRVYVNAANLQDRFYEQKLGFPREGLDLRLGFQFTAP